MLVRVDFMIHKWISWDGREGRQLEAFLRWDEIIIGNVNGGSGGIIARKYKWWQRRDNCFWYRDVGFFRGLRVQKWEWNGSRKLRMWKSQMEGEDSAKDKWWQMGGIIESNLRMLKTIKVHFCGGGKERWKIKVMEKREGACAGIKGNFYRLLMETEELECLNGKWERWRWEMTRCRFRWVKEELRIRHVEGGLEPIWWSKLGRKYKEKKTSVCRRERIGRWKVDGIWSWSTCVGKEGGKVRMGREKVKGKGRERRTTNIWREEEG